MYLVTYVTYLNQLLTFYGFNYVYKAVFGRNFKFFSL